MAISSTELTGHSYTDKSRDNCIVRGCSRYFHESSIRDHIDYEPQYFYSWIYQLSIKKCGINIFENSHPWKNYVWKSQILVKLIEINTVFFWFVAAPVQSFNKKNIITKTNNSIFLFSLFLFFSKKKTMTISNDLMYR